MIPWRRIKILPLLVFVAALSFSVRMSEFVAGYTAAPGSAFAEEAAPPSDGLKPPTEAASTPAEGEVAAEADAKKDEVAQADPKTVEGKESAPADAPEAAKAAAGESPAHPGDTAPPPAEEKPEWKDSLDSDYEFSEVKMELFEDLASRRKDLDEREREQVLREVLLKAAEQEINQKYKEMEALKAEIQSLLVQQSEEEAARITSLVKIYEGMKAKDAARIFDTLDMDVLLQVISRMSERKSAPIIAAMNPDRARSVTIMLAEQKALPNLSDPLIPQN